MAHQLVARGKPADYGQEIVRRRSRVTSACVALAGCRVLDFGSGNGAQTVELLKHGCSIVACDIDERDLAVLTSYAREHCIGDVTAVLYDGTTLPFPDGHFDVVVSYAVLEHVEEESRALNEIHRVLRPGGDLVISVPNKWWLFETHGARLPLLPWNRVPFFSWLPGPMHRRFARARIYRKAGFVRMLEAHQFAVLATSYITAPMDVIRSPLLRNVLRTVVFRGDRSRLPFLSTEVLAHCRRK
ncbi:MAG TPA: class I SAM-dependent methyltransferase [Bacteroidota bacterium]|nr:class I SAM-dependent methyltransferase [Bacteroidota bacterium]